MDHSKQRPVLPGVTTVPNQRNYAGRTQNTPGQAPVLASTVKLGNKLSFSSSLGSLIIPGDISAINNNNLNINTNSKNKIYDKTLHKLLSKLPYQLREDVTSVVNMTIGINENTKSNVQSNSAEILRLRGDLKDKIKELEISLKTVLLYRERHASLEDKVEGLKDGLSIKEKVVIKNKKVITRLTATNRMLIDSLDALRINSSTNDIASNATTPAISNRPNTLVPIENGETVLATTDVKDTTYQLNNTNKPPRPSKNTEAIGSSKSDKLRESLLRISREHYRSLKFVEVMEVQVDELRQSLKKAENANRHLRLEVDEIRSIQHRASSPKNDKTQMGVNTSKSDTPIEIKDSELLNKRSYFGKVDERFTALINRNAFDISEGLIQFRRLVGYLVTAPATLNLTDIVSFIVTKDLMKIFDCEMVCLFLNQDRGPGIINKYTPRHVDPEFVDIRDSKSILADTYRTGQMSRSNVIGKSSLYSYETDGCIGVVAKRILAIPLIDPMNDNQIIGSMHFINKLTSYSEVDELFTMVFADFVSQLVISCNHYKEMSTKSSTLYSLLDIPQKIYKVLPDPDSFSCIKGLLPDEIIKNIEEISCSCLKGLQCKVFLDSSQCQMEEGNLLSIDVSHGLSGLKSTPITSGIAGHVFTTKSTTICELNDDDIKYINPEVDLDPKGKEMVTFPVFNLYGDSLAVIQIILGPHSPLLHAIFGEKQEHQVYFIQISEWLMFQINGPLQILMESVGRAPSRPPSSPSGVILPNAYNFGGMSQSSTPANGDKSETPTLKSSLSSNKLTSSNKNLSIKIEEEKSIPVENMYEDETPIIDPKMYEELELLLAQKNVSNEELLTKIEADNLLKEQFLLEMTELELLNENLKKSNDKIKVDYDILVASELAAKESFNSFIQTSKDSTNADDLAIAQMEVIETQNKAKIVEIENKFNITIKELNDKCATSDIELTNRTDSFDKIKNEKDNLDKELINAQELLKKTKLEHDEIIAKEKIEHEQNMASEIEKLNIIIKQKDSVVAIMKEQLVKMATDSLKDIEKEHNKGNNVEEIDEWVETFDDNGAIYYLNNVTGESSWDFKSSIPKKVEAYNLSASSVSGDSAITRGDWVQHFDEASGKQYWVNQISGESQWELPSQNNVSNVNNDVSGGGSSASAGGYTIEL
jgi:hypothetical protein